MSGLHNKPASSERTAIAGHRDLVAAASVTALDLCSRELVGMAVDAAIKLGRPTTAIGATPHGLLVVCIESHAECMTLPGVIIAIPDLVEAEWSANGHDAPHPLPRLVREDGRSAALVISTGLPSAGGAR